MVDSDLLIPVCRISLCSASEKKREKIEKMETRLYMVYSDLLTPVCRTSLCSSSEKKREKREDGD
jgi:hypothetical protein